MHDRLRAILIGGTSNIGKSTVAQALAARLGWSYASTDGLARYPGRPWPTPAKGVPPHVVEHYLGLDDDELVTGQLTHYQNMWPMVETLLRAHAEDPAAERLVLEGSGVWPDYVAGLHLPDVGAIWLTGGPGLIKSRIHGESHYEQTDAAGRQLIDRFVARSSGYDLRMMEAVRRLGLPYIEVTPEMSVEQLCDQCLACMRPLD